MDLLIAVLAFSAALLFGPGTLAGSPICKCVRIPESN